MEKANGRGQRPKTPAWAAQRREWSHEQASNTMETQKAVHMSSSSFPYSMCAGRLYFTFKS